MNNKGLMIGFGLLLVVAMISIYMVSTSRKPSQTKQSQPEVATSSPVSSVASDSSNAQSAIKEIVVAVGDEEYSFSPSSISLTQGEETKIIFKNNGKLPHNFVIDGLEISTKTIGSGKEDSAIVKADKTGKYTFYCSIGNHRQLGMEGQLLVK